jgi:hypothetical protein
MDGKNTCMACGAGIGWLLYFILFLFIFYFWLGVCFVLFFFRAFVFFFHLTFISRAGDNTDGVASEKDNEQLHKKDNSNMPWSGPQGA